MNQLISGMDEADPVFICISVKEVTEQLIAAFFVLFIHDIKECPRRLCVFLRIVQTEKQKKKTKKERTKK